MSKGSQRYGNSKMAPESYLVRRERNSSFKLATTRNSNPLATKWYGQGAKRKADLLEEIPGVLAASRGLALPSAEGNLCLRAPLFSEDNGRLHSWIDSQNNVKIVQEKTASALSKQRYQWVKGFKIKELNRSKF
jgi:hypothetical protein